MPSAPDPIRFERPFRVGWGDVDGNGHFANRAILDRAADTRLLFFEENGFSVSRFAQERIGPVISRDELRYRHELRLGEEYSVQLAALGLSADGVRFQLVNTFQNSAREVTAIVTSDGVWFDLETRRPRLPPPELDTVQRAIPRAAQYAEIPARSP